MVEGFIINSTARMCDVSKLTILRLLADIGNLCRDYHDLAVRGLACKRVQVDEVWSFVGCKRRAKSKDEKRYSPPKCNGCRKNGISGFPDVDHISTSFIERSNLTLRMANRRHTRLTNAFSKRLVNHEHAISLHYFHYNFIADTRLSERPRPLRRESRIGNGRSAT